MTDKYDEIWEAKRLMNDSGASLRNYWQNYTRLYPPATLKEWQEAVGNDYRSVDADKKEFWMKGGKEQVEVPSEMFEFINVLYHSANTGKYDKNNWLKPDGKNSDHKSMCASMFRHLAAAEQGQDKDKDSGFHPLLHLAARALMLYTRKKRNLA